MQRELISQSLSVLATSIPPTDACEILFQLIETASWFARGVQEFGYVDDLAISSPPISDIAVSGVIFDESGIIQFRQVSVVKSQFHPFSLFLRDVRSFVILVGNYLGKLVEVEGILFGGMHIGQNLAATMIAQRIKEQVDVGASNFPGHGVRNSRHTSSALGRNTPALLSF